MSNYNPVDYSPAIPEFPVVNPFLPCYGKFDLTTYMQGASDYEIMANLVQLYNTMAKGYNDVQKLSTDTATAYNQLQAFVNGYFENLDVQQEINNKLDSMRTDGSLATVLNKALSDDVQTATTNWLNTNVKPVGSAVIVDKSLTIESAAADAKVTGDKFKETNIKIDSLNKDVLNCDLNNAKLTTEIKNETNRAVARENEIEKLFSAPTQDAVDKYLDLHPEVVTKPVFGVAIDKLPLGDNILSDNGWIKGVGWTGNFSEGFAHTAGFTETLECEISSYENAIYVLVFTATNQASATGKPDLVATVGGVEPYEQYLDDGTVTQYLAFNPTSGNVVFTPSSTWTGTVSAIGLYKIDSNAQLPYSLTIKDANSEPSFEITVSDTNLNNISIGKNTLNKVISANRNIAIGNECLKITPTGYYNTAIGDLSQRDSINGTRNVSIGYASMAAVTYGDRNIAVGTFALSNLTTGRNNIGIGADAAWNTNSGSNNIALSNGALNNNTTGNGNIALGYFANSANTTGGTNISIGHLTNGYNTTGSNNIALGYQSHYYGTNDLQNIAIGYQTMFKSDSEKHTHNIAIGYQAIKTNSGNENIGIGTGVLTTNVNKSEYNIAIGADLMNEITSSGNACNIAIGEGSMWSITGTNNVAIGRDINRYGGSNNIGIGLYAIKNNKADKNIGIGLRALVNATTGSNNIAIGYNSGENVTTASNTISINSTGRNADNSVYIGDALHYDGSTLGLCGLDPQSYANVIIPAGNESKVPLLINAGTLSTGTHPGAIEFDGTHLYITDDSGKRHQLSEVN